MGPEPDRLAQWFVAHNPLQMQVERLDWFLEKDWFLQRLLVKGALEESSISFGSP